MRATPMPTSRKILDEESGKGGFPFVLHCFSSGIELARTGLALGGYISFSGILTFKNSAIIQEVAGFAPADRILVETDAPYLAPGALSRQDERARHRASHGAEAGGGEGRQRLPKSGRRPTANFYRLFAKAGP